MLTKTRIAVQLKVSTYTVDNWIESGELEAVDVRRYGSKRPKWRITEDALAVFLEKRSNFTVTKQRRVAKIPQLI